MDDLSPQQKVNIAAVEAASRLLSGSYAGRSVESTKSDYFQEIMTQHLLRSAESITAFNVSNRNGA